jgi:UDP-glucose 4-epimerase
MLVTGGSGFVGSHLTERLLTGGHEVIVVDNFSTGRKEFLDNVISSKSCKLIHGDLLDEKVLDAAMHKVEFVWHLAANADVRYGTDFPRRDLEQNTVVTFNVLESMRRNGVRNIAFSSTASVYGETPVIPTPEDCPFPEQTSLYGASKLACEGLISAYCEGFDMHGWIFRFVSILGERYTHGHIFDFFRQLRSNPRELHILGDGEQKKSYLYVHDCIDALLEAVKVKPKRAEILNLGTDEYINVNDSVDIITSVLDCQPVRTYTNNDRGWVGDIPFILLDCTKMRSFGWSPRHSIREGVIKTVMWLQNNLWVY